MSSIPSRDDVKFRAYELGIKNPYLLNAFMDLLDRYTIHQAHKMNGWIEPPPVFSEAKEYLCRGCKKEKPLIDFPDAKHRDPTRNMNCMACQGKARYKCTGPCKQMKPLSEFPEHKQDNPRIPSACNYCAPRIITMKDAGYSRREVVS